MRASDEFQVLERLLPVLAPLESCTKLARFQALELVESAPVVGTRRRERASCWKANLGLGQAARQAEWCLQLATADAIRV